MTAIEWDRRVQDADGTPAAQRSVILADFHELHSARTDVDGSARFGVPVDGSGSAVGLSGFLGAVLSDAPITRDNRFVYANGISSSSQLLAVPLDGSGPARSLSAPRGSIRSYCLTSDGQNVLFATDPSSGFSELYRAPLAASGSGPIRLSDPAIDGGELGNRFELSPDGRYVVYGPHPLRNVQSELFSTLFDGSQAPVRLNGPLPPLASVKSFSIGPRSKRVVYVADQDTELQRELYSTPIAKSTPIKISGPLVAVGGVEDFFLSPDGRYAVYHADAVRSGAFGVYSTLVREPGNAKRLNNQLTIDGNVMFSTITADSKMVIYRADELVDTRFQLFLAPIDDSFERILFNRPFTSTQDDYQLTPDGELCVYVSDDHDSGVMEVFARPTSLGPFFRARRRPR